MRFIIFFILLFNTTLAQELDTTIYTIVEQMPLFSSCDSTEIDYHSKKLCSDYKLVAYIHSHLNISESIQPEELHSSIIVVTFIINTKGFVTHLKIIKSVHPDIDKNILNLLQDMPQWIPSKHNGKTVNVSITLPIRICFR